MTKVSLRPLALNDLENIMQWVNDKEVIGKFAGFIVPKTREDERQYLENILSSETDKIFAIESETGRYLGNIGLHEIDQKDKIARIGIILGDKTCWGKGYAQGAIGELLKIAFNKYQLRKVWLICYAQNTKMQHIAQKLGFEEDGILKEVYFHNGSYQDIVRMSLLKEKYFVGDEE